MEDVYIVSAARTALGKIGGTLKKVQPEVLLTTALQGALDKSGVDKELLDEVVCGQAKQTTDAPNIARVASLMLRVPESTPAYTVHRQCASGMQAILSGMMQIMCGYSDVVLTGGVESMSTAPFYIRNARFGVGNGNAVFVDPNIESQPKSQPNDIYGTFNMIQTADNVSRKYHITREEQDAFAFASQQKAIAAIDSGRFKDEIVPVMVPQRKGNPIVFDTDEFPKRDTSLKKLAKLKPIFKDGFVTAGNASGRNDGASAVLIMSGKKVKELGLHPMARIIAGAAAGVDPRYMGMGPVAATRKLLQRIWSNIISGKVSERWEIEDKLALLGIHLNQDFIISIFSKSNKYQNWFQYLNAHFRKKILLNSETEVVMFCGMEEFNYPFSILKNEFKEVFPNNLVVTSDVFSNVQNIRMHYSTTLHIFQLLKSLNMKGLYRVDDWLSSALLLSAKDSDEYRMVEQLILKPILEYDKKYNTCLFATLETAISTNSLEMTAKKLFVHINTIRYRLQKIQNLTSKSFFNFSDRYLLYAAVLLKKTLRDNLAELGSDES